ncbi:uncharacterized protein LOC103704917 [Phoenix dactylifera]|uniref:Uncharacterized protein LOC103704917 n=1 Tax=Phoenix dactylifera TaxID=42345 RepID=A0A8B7BW83_PHODC|nr:uncharacterized protein LOC103704917 [Phoenix dactylifera]
MSIALERRNGMGGSGFGGGIPCFPIYEAREGRRIDRREEEGEEEEEEAGGRGMEDGKGGELSCSSSIGRNSEGSAGGSGSDGEESGETEVQSRYKGPMETMDALEESLPIRHGISKFYCGKSKSFTNLADVSSYSSAKVLAKPENPYNRKRKNLLAFNIMYERSQSNELRSMEGGISKRPAISSRCTSASTMSMSCSESNSNNGEEDHDPSRLLPPRYPHSRAAASVASAPFDISPPEKSSFPMRSFSLTDLEGAVSSNSSISPREKHKRN